LFQEAIRRIMRTVNYYEILGIPHKCTSAEIKKAFRDNVKDYHPDKVDHLGEDLKLHAKRKMILITEARDILLNTELRKEYDKLWLEIQNNFISIECKNCGYLNKLPKQLRPGVIRCRECSAGLNIKNKTVETPPLESIIKILSSTILTLRNMYYFTIADLGLVLDLEGLQIDIRTMLNDDRSPNLYAIVNNRELHEYLSISLNYSYEKWDDKCQVGWIFLPRGSDEEVSKNIVNRLANFVTSSTNWKLRLEPFSPTLDWSHWASVFILTSIYPLSPWKASSLLHDYNGNLLSIGKGLSLSENIIENLKNNWKIFLMGSRMGSSMSSGMDSQVNLKSESIKEKEIIKKELKDLELQIEKIRRKL
jgi:curved DNA-binding protein CbpA